MVCLLLMPLASADEFSLPPASEFGEVWIDTLGLRNADRNQSLVDKSLINPFLGGQFLDGVPADAIESLEHYPLSEEELGLVFDAAKAEEFVQREFGQRESTQRASQSDTFDEPPDLAETRFVPNLVPQPVDEKPTNVLSLTPQDQTAVGVHLDVDPEEEEVILNWFVEF